ncbi:MAG: DUF4105 domain-containing protein [Nitrospirae bacterium]|nr:DUF4105 domain-containing protein [Candidatus Manganitrophaceae bacterium]
MNTKHIFVLLIFFFVFTLTSTAFAQSSKVVRLSPNAEVLLVTIGPGALVWERFGHNGLWIRDPENGIDQVYHWGLFDFQSDNFWPKFLQGYMDYSIGSVDSPSFFQFTMQSDRDIWLQEINLDADQKNALLAFLEKNDSEGHRIYRYDYYLDNCSTRARDALDHVLGGVIKKASVDKGSGKTFRSNTRRLLQNIPLAYFGIHLGLGHPADDEISIWKDMFTPMSLRRHLNEIKLLDGQSLVRSDKFIFNSTKTKEPEQIKSYLSFYLPLSASFGVFFAFLGYLTVVKRRLARLFLALFGILWSLVSGLLGTIILIVWFLTEHRFGHWNENILQFNPLSLVLLGYFLIFLIRGRLPQMGIKLLYAVTGLSLLGLVMQIIPVFDQVNGELIALALPAHLGLLWAVRSEHLISNNNLKEPLIKSGEKPIVAGQ